MILKITTRNNFLSTYTLTFLLKSMKSIRPCFYRAAECSEPVFDNFISASLYSDKGKCIKHFSALELSELRYSLNTCDIVYKQIKRFKSPEK